MSQHPARPTRRPLPGQNLPCPFQQTLLENVAADVGVAAEKEEDAEDAGDHSGQHGHRVESPQAGGGET